MIHWGNSWATARCSFGLGLACGLLVAGIGFAIHGRLAASWSSMPGANDSRAASTDAWRHPVPSAGLSDSVRVSAVLLSAGRPVVADAAPGSGSVPDLLARAEEHRRKREFQQACALYAAVATQGGMTADAWADYADAQASASGRLAGAPARAIEAALLLEPGHAKALWLKASLAHEERRYSDALKAWRQLQALMPPGSSDAKIIEANIAEASRLAAG